MPAGHGFRETVAVTRETGAWDALGAVVGDLAMTSWARLAFCTGEMPQYQPQLGTDVSLYPKLATQNGQAVCCTVNASMLRSHVQHAANANFLGCS